MKKTFLAIAAILAITTCVTAQNKRNENTNLRGEKVRVAQGVRSGEITRGEAVVIKKQAQDVKQATQAARADGVVTRAERARIAKQDAQLDRTIRRTKHNNRTRH